MSNPDIKSPTTDSLTTAFPVAILFFLITLIIFQFKESIHPFKYILWIGFPIITLIIVAITNTVSQYISCKTVNFGKALLGSLPSVGAILIGLGISSISYCRIPIASVFAPLIVGQTIDVTQNKNTTTINSLKNSNSKECCISKLSLETIENNYPLIEGISYGFYILFSALFGVVIGTGISTIC
jgi:hypothetical protein